MLKIPDHARLWNKLGPFFGLLLVLALFATLLALKDISEARGGNASGNTPRANWLKGALSCRYDGLKAFISVALLCLTIALSTSS